MENFFDLTGAPDTSAIATLETLGLPIRALDGSDRLTGTNQADQFYGNDGADVLLGSMGNDILQGGVGSDLLFGNEGDDDLAGQRGNDVLFGGQGNDVISGQTGIDFLSGDFGSDTLTGGIGADAFVLDLRQGVSDRAAADVITDFKVEEGDLLALGDANQGVGLTAAAVTLETVGADTFVSVAATGEVLAKLVGVTADQLTSAVFTTVQATLDDSEAGAPILAALPGNITRSGEVNEIDFFDMFRLPVTEPSIVDLQLTGLSGDADLLLYRDLNGDGEIGGSELISAAQRIGIQDESIVNVTLEPDTYFVAVSQYQGDTPYNLSIVGVPGEIAADLAGDRPATARPLSITGDVDLHDHVGQVDAAGIEDVDTYRVDLLVDGYFDVFTDYQRDDVGLILFQDTNGNGALEEDEAIAAGTNTIALDTLAAGTYYVQAGALNAPTPYEILALSAPGSRADEFSPTTLFPGITTTGTLALSDELDLFDDDNFADFYRLTDVAPGQTITITQQSSDFDSYLTVYDLASGEIIATGDDIDAEAGNLNAQVSFSADNLSNYLILASSTDGPGLGDYTLDATLSVPTVNTLPREARNFDQLFGEMINKPEQNQGQNLLNQSKPTATTEQAKNAVQLTTLKESASAPDALVASLGALFGRVSNVSQAGAAATAASNTLKSNAPSVVLYNSAQQPLRSYSVDNATFAQDWAAGFAAAFKERLGSPAVAGDEFVNLRQVTPIEIWPRITGNKEIQVLKLDDRDPSAVPFVALSTVETDSSLTNRGANSRFQLLNRDASGKWNSVASGDFLQFQQRLQTELGNGRAIVATTRLGVARELEGRLRDRTNYSVHDVVTLNDRPFVLVRNPAGVDNAQGIGFVEAPDQDPKDGFMYVPYLTFVRAFEELTLL